MAHEVPDAQADELTALLALRDTATALLDLEATSPTETPAMATLRGELNACYDAYLGRFGPINRYTLRGTGRRDPQTGKPRTTRVYPSQGGFRTDPASAVVYALGNSPHRPDRSQSGTGACEGGHLPRPGRRAPRRGRLRRARPTRWRSASTSTATSTSR